MSDKIEVKSLVTGMVGISMPHRQRRFEWPRKGAVVKIDRELFDELMYDPGAEFMFKNGILFIQDMDIKKEMGIEPEDATQPVNLVELTDERMKRMSTVMPINEFRTEFKKMPETMRRELVNYVVNNSGAVSMERIDAIKEISGIDVAKAIQLKKANEEEVKEG